MEVNGYQDLAGELRNLLGDDAVLTDPAEISGFVSDLSGHQAGTASMAVRPRTAAELSAVMKMLKDRNVTVVPRGGGTGLVGGALVLPGSQSVVVISLERMRAIRSIDPIGNLMHVEAGCVLADARHAAQQAGFFLSIDHGGAASSQIGGNIATNAGGNNVLRYGMMRDQVLGLEVVLPDGTIVDGMQQLQKNNTGYDLKQLFIGSEGTLGIVTAAVLRLRPYPGNRMTAALAVRSPAAALQLLSVARTELAETLSAFELIPRLGVEIQHETPERQQFLAIDTPWYVLVEAETASTHFDLEAAMEALFERATTRDLATDGILAQSIDQRDAIWRVREGIAFMMIETPSSLKSDTAVPLTAIPDFIEKATAAVNAEVPGCYPIPFGHLGDGNIHFNVLRPEGISPETFKRFHPALTEQIEKTALEHGGTISAEHGIGYIKKKSMHKMHKESHIELLRKIKNAFDPDIRLNIAKIL